MRRDGSIWSADLSNRALEGMGYRGIRNSSASRSEPVEERLRCCTGKIICALRWSLFGVFEFNVIYLEELC